MPRGKSCRHGQDYPCTCAMGNLYRFVEPVVLLLLKKKGRSYGYDLGNDLQEQALTDAEIERGALYRTLRNLEANGNVVGMGDRKEWTRTPGLQTDPERREPLKGVGFRPGSCGEIHGAVCRGNQETGG